MPYVNKRSRKKGPMRFTGLYKAADGRYKSAGTFDAEVRARDVHGGIPQHCQYRGQQQGNPTPDT